MLREITLHLRLPAQLDERLEATMYLECEACEDSRLAIQAVRAVTVSYAQSVLEMNRRLESLIAQPDAPANEVDRLLRSMVLLSHKVQGMDLALNILEGRDAELAPSTDGDSSD